MGRKLKRLDLTLTCAWQADAVISTAHQKDFCQTFPIISLFQLFSSTSIFHLPKSTWFTFDKAHTGNLQVKISTDQLPITTVPVPPPAHYELEGTVIDSRHEFQWKLKDPRFSTALPFSINQRRSDHICWPMRSSCSSAGACKGGVSARIQHYSAYL